MIEATCAQTITKMHPNYNYNCIRNVKRAPNAGAKTRTKIAQTRTQISQSRTKMAPSRSDCVFVVRRCTQTGGQSTANIIHTISKTAQPKLHSRSSCTFGFQRISLCRLISFMCWRHHSESAGINSFASLRWEYESITTFGLTHRKIASIIIAIMLDRNWNSFQLANNAPPLSVTGRATAPSARMVGLV